MLLEHFRVTHPHSIFKHLRIDEAKLRANLQLLIAQKVDLLCQAMAVFAPPSAATASWTLGEPGQ